MTQLKKNIDYSKTLDSTDKYTILNAEIQLKMIKEKTLKQIEETEQLITVYEAEANKKDFKDELIISSPMENYEALDLLGKIAVGFLLLNYALFNCFITLVFILYGNYLIEKFDLESRYPKLVTWINLRKKFQRYFLIFSLSGIGVIILIQFTFWFFILSLHH